MPKAAPNVRRPLALPAIDVSIEPKTPEDYARGEQRDQVERSIDCARLREIATDRSPAGRPEVRDASDTIGHHRYGFSDGTGRTSLVVGRGAETKNRDPR